MPARTTFGTLMLLFALAGLALAAGCRELDTNGNDREKARNAGGGTMYRESAPMGKR